MKSRPTTNRLPPRRPKSLFFGAPVSVRSPSGELIAPDHLERIEELDDVIFAALEGDSCALDQSAAVYHRASRDTPEELLHESRERYLHRAESIVERYSREPSRSLAQTFAALEILTLVAEA